jgi:hypothetical protein
LSAILPYVSIVERELLIEWQQKAFNNEKKFKNNTKMIQCLAEAMMDCSQTIVDTWVHVANQENRNNSFVNRKL